MSEATEQQTNEVSNPYEGMFGTRNGIKVPWVGRAVQKGADKGKPYITLDAGKLSDSDFVTAVGIGKLRELAEAALNVAGRNFCEDNTDSDGLVKLDEFQKWADGIVQERVSKKELQDRANELLGNMAKGTITEAEMKELTDIAVEISSRTRESKK